VQLESTVGCKKHYPKQKKKEKSQPNSPARRLKDKLSSLFPTYQIFFIFHFFLSLISSFSQTDLSILQEHVHMFFTFPWTSGGSPPCAATFPRFRPAATVPTALNRCRNPKTSKKNQVQPKIHLNTNPTSKTQNHLENPNRKIKIPNNFLSKKLV
jgi:hypothetical protein